MNILINKSILILRIPSASSFYTHSIRSCPSEQILPLVIQAHSLTPPPPPLSVTPDPKLPPVVKPTAPLELSLDLVFP